MKKQFLPILALMSVSATASFGLQGAHWWQRLEEDIGLRPRPSVSASAEAETRAQGVRRTVAPEAPELRAEHRVDFWQKVIEGLRKLGYDENSDYIKHATSNLHKAQTHAEQVRVGGTVGRPMGRVLRSFPPRTSPKKETHKLETPPAAPSTTASTTGILGGTEPRKKRVYQPIKESEKTGHTGTLGTGKAKAKRLLRGKQVTKETTTQEKR